MTFEIKVFTNAEWAAFGAATDRPCGVCGMSGNCRLNGPFAICRKHVFVRTTIEVLESMILRASDFEIKALRIAIAAIKYQERRASWARATMAQKIDWSGE